MSLVSIPLIRLVSARYCVKAPHQLHLAGTLRYCQLPGFSTHRPDLLTPKNLTSPSKVVNKHSRSWYNIHIIPGPTVVTEARRDFTCGAVVTWQHLFLFARWNGPGAQRPHLSAECIRGYFSGTFGSVSAHDLWRKGYICNKKKNARFRIGRVQFTPMCSSNFGLRGFSGLDMFCHENLSPTMQKRTCRVI